MRRNVVHLNGCLAGRKFQKTGTPTSSHPLHSSKEVSLLHHPVPRTYVCTGPVRPVLPAAAFHRHLLGCLRGGVVLATLRGTQLSTLLHVGTHHSHACCYPHSVHHHPSALSLHPLLLFAARRPDHRITAFLLCWTELSALLLSSHPSTIAVSYHLRPSRISDGRPFCHCCK
jgi:hypothetical protein